MSINSTHPSYDDVKDDWTKIDDVFGGQRVVKDKDETYLPATGGHKLDGFPTEGTAGKKDYDGYKERALFHGFFRSTVEETVGVMHRKPAHIELPKRLEEMLERATPRGEPLHALLRRVTERQLKHGRIGLLLDVPEGAGPTAVPYIAPYGATKIINWDDGHMEQGLQELEFVVLDESGKKRQGSLQWRDVKQYRILARKSIAETLTAHDQGAPAMGPYQTATVTDQEGTLTIPAADWKVPSLGGEPFQRIPFVFINAADLEPEPEVPPLIELANLAIAIYQQEADYRQTLHMQGQATLVKIGAGEGDPSNTGAETKTGAGAVIEIDSPEGDAKWIVPPGDSLAEQRTALENRLMQARAKSMELADARSGQKESGEALKTRMAGRTATLATIAQTGAEGVKELLREAAELVGANPDEVVIEPNLDFGDRSITPKDLEHIAKARATGQLVMSARSVHALERQHDYTTMTFEEEQEALAEEAMEGADGRATRDIDPAGGNPPPDDDDEDDDEGEGEEDAA